MEKQERRQYQDETDAYLDKVSGRYVFDSASGIYRQKPSQHHENSGSADATGRYKWIPFWVNVQRDWIVIAISGFTTLLLFVTVYYSHKQWKAMNDTLCEARKQTRNSVLFFRTDERAWLELGPLEATGTSLSTSITKLRPDAKGVGGTATIRNYGKTVARNISLRETLQNGDETFGRPNSPRLEYIEKSLTLSRNTSTNKKEWIYIYSPPTPSALAPGSALASSIPIGGVFYPGLLTYVVGRITYTDSFGVDHWATFCYRINESSSREYCESGNDEDANPEYVSQ